MKKIIILLALSFTMNLYAEQYIVVFDKNTKKQIKSFTLPDSEPLPKYDNPNLIIIKVTKEEYEMLSNCYNWNKATENWLKKEDNLKKLNEAISKKDLELKIEKKIKLKKELNTINELLKTATKEESVILQKKKNDIEKELNK